MFILLLIASILVGRSDAQLTTSEFNMRVDAGARECFYERGDAGQMMEVYYQVVDGQHGDLDVSLDVIDPTGNKIINDYKKSENSIIKDLVIDGEYAFCLDNTYSNFNSKLVFVYVSMESQENDTDAVVTVLDGDGKEEQTETLTWLFNGTSEDSYYVKVEVIANSLTRTLKHVVKARHMLSVYSATKSRDSYLAFEETFIVDAWSGFQIGFMCIVGLLQVFMIKKLFKSPTYSR